MMNRCSQVISLFSLFISIAAFVSATETFKCALEDSVCWASYARMATNAYRRNSGITVPLKAVQIEGAIVDAQEQAKFLAQTGTVLPREEPGNGCGWWVGTELVAGVPLTSAVNVAEECVKIWYDNPHTQGPLLEPGAVYSAYGQAEKDGIVYCIQTFINIHEDEDCETRSTTESTSLPAEEEQKEWEVENTPADGVKPSEDKVDNEDEEAQLHSLPE